MKNHELFQDMPVWMVCLILFLVFWEMVWKLIAFWRSARNNHLAWFIIIGVINSAGILPIVYLLLNRRKKE